MSMEEKYGTFEIKNIVHYDEVEREHFSKVFWETYKGYVYKLNGKKVMGHGVFKKLSKEEWRNLGTLKMYVKEDEQNGITEISGYGHRNAIFPLEFWLRKLFDDGRVVVYDASDTCQRSIDYDYDYEPKSDPDIRDFYTEKKRRLQVLKDGGQLELPEYRREEVKKLAK